MLTNRQATYITNLIWRDLVHTIEAEEKMGLFYVGIDYNKEAVVIELVDDNNPLIRRILFAGNYRNALNFLKKYQP